MKIAIPIWNNRIAPVFDTISTILIFSQGDTGYTVSKELTVGDLSVPEKISALLESQVSTIICGAIPYRFEKEFLNHEIEVCSFIAGSIFDVLIAYETNTISNDEYKMPGCKKRNHSR